MDTGLNFALRRNRKTFQSRTLSQAAGGGILSPAVPAAADRAETGAEGSGFASRTLSGGRSGFTSRTLSGEWDREVTAPAASGGASGTPVSAPAQDSEVQRLRTRLQQLEAQRTELTAGLDLNSASQVSEEMSRLNDQLRRAEQAQREAREQAQRQERRAGYDALRAAPDFGERSVFRSTLDPERPVSMYSGVGGVYYDTGGYGDVRYDYINKQPQAVNAYEQNNRVMLMAGAGDDWLQQMSADEVAVYNYLYATGGKEKAEEYVQWLRPELTARQRGERESQAADFAGEHPAAASAGSVLMSPARGLSYLGQAIDYAADGSIDQNAGYNQFSYIPSAARSQVSRDIEDKVEGFWGKAGSFAYQTGMSMADFLLNAAVGGGLGGGLGEQAASGLTLAIMGTGAAADATISAKDRGLTDSQAFALGTIAGAAEIITENISLEALLKPDWEKGILVYVLKNTLAEGSEEVGSDLINLVADILISREKSEWSRAVAGYEEQGYSHAEALGLAVGDQALNMGVDFLGGALSGGIMAGAAGGVHAAESYRSGRQLRSMSLSGEDIRAFVDEGLAAGEDTQANALARAARERLDAGGELTDYELGRLYSANIRAVDMDARADPEPDLSAAAQESAEGESGGGLIVRAAEEMYSAGRLSDDTAGLILSDPEALDLVREYTGLELDGENEGQALEALRRALEAEFTGTGQGSDGAQGGRSTVLEGLERAGRSLGRAGQTALAEFYDGASDTADYFGGFAVWYRAGMTGIPPEQVSGGRDGTLNSAQRQAAYLAGQADAGSSLERQLRDAGQARTAAESGLVYDEYVRQAVDRETAVRLDEVSRALGVSVRFVEQVAGGKANAQIRGSQVLVERGNRNPVQYLLGHEWTHRVQELAPEAYREFRSAAAADESFRADLAAIQAAYDRRGMEVSQEELLDEAAANFAGRLMEDGALLDEFIARHRDRRTLLEKLRDAIRALVRKLTGAEKRRAQTAEGKLSAALDAAAEQIKTPRAGEEKTAARETDGGEARYSINDRFSRDIRVWDEEGRPAGERFILGSTGPVLQGLGAIESDIYMNGDKVSAILEQHPEMTVREIQRIPELLEDPVLVLKSQGSSRTGQNTRLVVFGSVKAQNGQPVMAVLDLRPVEGRLVVDDMQKVNSSYTRDNAVSYIQRCEILHADEKRTAQLLRTIGLHGPIELQKSGSMGSISYHGQNVNLTGEKFSDVVNPGNEDVKPRYSIKYDADNTPYVEVEQDILAGVPRSEWVWTVKDNLRRKFPEGITVGSNVIKVNSQSWGEMTYSKYTQRLMKRHPDLYADKLRATDSADEIMKASRDWVNESLAHPRKDSIQEFARGSVQLRIGTSDYTAEVVVAKRSDGELLLYDLLHLKQTAIKEKAGHGKVNTRNPQSETGSQAVSSKDSIPQSGEAVNPNYSLKGSEMTREMDALRQESLQLQAWVEKRVGTPWSRDSWTLDDAERMARRLNRDFDSRLDPKQLGGRLWELGETITGREGSWENVLDRAMKIAGEIVDKAVIVDDEMYRQYEDLRSYLRKTRLYVPRSMWADLEAAGGYNELRKRYFGRLNLSSAQGTGIDQAYKALAERFPEFFDESRTSDTADQLLELTEVLDSLVPVYENPFGGDRAAARSHVAYHIVAELSQWNKVGQAQENARRSIARVRRNLESREARVRERIRHVQQMQRLRREDGRERQRLLTIARRLRNRKLPAVTRALVEQYIGELDTAAVRITGKTVRDLEQLQLRYEDMMANDPEAVADPHIEKMLQRLRRKQISQLTPDEVAELTDVLLGIEHQIAQSNKLIAEADRRDVYHMREETVRNIEQSGGDREAGPLGRLWSQGIVSSTLSPVRMLRRMTGYVDSDPLVRLGNALADGQRTAMDYEMRAGQAFRPFARDKAFSRFFSGKGAERIRIAGFAGTDSTQVVQAEITPAMRVSLYLHSLNPQNLAHIVEGGITVPDPKWYAKGDMAEAYERGVTLKLTPTAIRRITGQMTAKERAFAQAVQRYFNETSRQAINGVSEQLKGYSIATVDNYFPIQTDKRFSHAEFESIKRDGTIEGMGWLKVREGRASNPVLLRDVNDVLDQAIRMHAKYVGLAIPVRNMSKLLKATEKGYEGSVMERIGQVWGKEGSAWLEQLLGDLQGTRKKKDGMLSRAMGKIKSGYAGAVLTGNLSVAMKQAASYPTAAAVLGWKPLALAMKDFGKVDLETIGRYTPLLWYRSLGFEEAEVRDMGKGGVRLPKALNWIQGVDVITTRKLWKAGEYYVRENSPQLVQGSEAYYREVAEIYNRVIEETQPNYTAMQRPQLLRSDDTLLGAISMFKTQPFQNFGILYDAAANLAAKGRQVQAGGDRTALKRAWRDFGRAVSSQLAQLGVFAGMTFAWALFRGRTDKYEDEDGEMSLQSVLTALGTDMAGGLFASVPFGSDVWELGSSMVTGERYYGMDAVNVSAISDAADAVMVCTVWWRKRRRQAPGEKSRTLTGSG